MPRTVSRRRFARSSQRANGINRHRFAWAGGQWQEADYRQQARGLTARQSLLSRLRSPANGCCERSEAGFSSGYSAFRFPLHLPSP
jgi:hypothetical protein